MTNMTPREMEAHKATVETMKREYINSVTPYQKWKAFEQTLSWAKINSELASILRMENIRLREEVSILQKRESEASLTPLKAFD